MAQIRLDPAADAQAPAPAQGAVSKGIQRVKNQTSFAALGAVAGGLASGILVGAWAFTPELVGADPVGSALTFALPVGLGAALLVGIGFFLMIAKDKLPKRDEWWWKALLLSHGAILALGLVLAAAMGARTGDLGVLALVGAIVALAPLPLSALAVKTLLEPGAGE